MPTAEPTNAGSKMPAFDAGPVALGGLALERRQLAFEQDKRPLGKLEARAAKASDWRPDLTYQSAVNRGAASYVGGYFSWTGSGLSSLPNGVGLEFEMNQRNPGVTAPTNKRPLCLDGKYKDRFWAKNYNYSWTALDSYGPGSPAGAYADYNDAEDNCQTQSIAVGVRYPKGLSIFENERALDISIYAPRGLVASNSFTGNIQAVHDQVCVAFPAMTLTDCMGVARIETLWGGYPVGEYNMSTGGSQRQMVAPGRCWQTIETLWKRYTDQCS